MKKFNEVWKVKEGTRTFWKVQAEKGILTFNTKKAAIKWAESIEKIERKIKNV